MCPLNSLDKSDKSDISCFDFLINEIYPPEPDPFLNNFFFDYFINPISFTEENSENSKHEIVKENKNIKKTEDNNIQKGKGDGKIRKFFKILKAKRKDKTTKKKIPIHYNYKAIKDIIQKLNISEELKHAITYDYNYVKLEKELNDKKLSLSKKRKRRGTIFKDDETEVKKRGRRAGTDYTRRKHDRYSGDNIIKKIKSNFCEYCLLFINNIINFYLSKTQILNYSKEFKKDKKDKGIPKNLIKLLSYKFVDKIKKENDLKLLDTPLKDLFSNDISPKYSTLPKDYNKKMIKLILKTPNANKYIMIAFNFKFREWIDIFTYKKSLSSFDYLDKEEIEELDKSFVKLDKLIEEIYYKTDDRKYLSYFLNYVFNYERWLLSKKGRNKVSFERNKS